MAGRVYSIEYKTQAVKRVTEDCLPVAQVSRELGINVNTLRKWVRRCKEDNTELFVGSGNQRTEPKTIRELEKRIKDLEEENAILKSGSHLCTEPKSMRFRFMYHHKNEYRVVKMAEVLNVTVGGYYSWLQRLNKDNTGEKEKMEITAVYFYIN